MATQQQIGGPAPQRSSSKIKVGILIFVVGMIAGVVGLCAAIKIIFYIGLCVAIIAAIALVLGIITIKNRIDNDDDE